MEELDRLIELISKQKGGTPKDYRLLMDQIGYLESLNIVDRKQMGGGPGRGIYQFEAGKKGSAVSAVRRASNFYKRNNMKVPSWVKKLSTQKDVDASTLTKDQQSSLFLVDKMERKGADFSKIWDGSKSVEDFYLDSHWAGRKSKRAGKSKYFKKGTEEYLDQSDGSEYSGKVKMYGDQIVPKYFSDPKGMRETFIEEQAKQKPIKNETTTNTYSFGGNTGRGPSTQGDINTYNTGGTHAENPLGGIPIGTGSNGKTNTVEEGEASFESEQGKYIFSNYINMDGTINKK